MATANPQVHAYQPELWLAADSLQTSDADSQIPATRPEVPIEQLLALNPENLLDWYRIEALRALGARNSQQGIIDAVKAGHAVNGKSYGESVLLARHAPEKTRELGKLAFEMFARSIGESLDQPDGPGLRLASKYQYFSDDYGGTGQVAAAKRSARIAALEAAIRERSKR